MTGASDDAEHPPCPACLAGSLETIYRVENIPAHSVLLMSSRTEAMDYPRRDLQLGFLRSVRLLVEFRL